MKRRPLPYMLSVYAWWFLFLFILPLLQNYLLLIFQFTSLFHFFLLKVLRKPLEWLLNNTGQLLIKITFWKSLCRFYIMWPWQTSFVSIYKTDYTWFMRISDLTWCRLFWCLYRSEKKYRHLHVSIYVFLFLIYIGSTTLIGREWFQLQNSTFPDRYHQRLRNFACDE